ncbi:T7SS effector LXG polymorphic toxin [Peribacillus butanolivorans]|uniref:T7SS effector LXG polymorphic toxin n=1 Tax=Peribacillus butanolivorans TaxID=421767 RepID=UPI0037F966F6
MKIYEANTLKTATKSRAEQYEKLKEQVVALKRNFRVSSARIELLTTQISFFEGIPASLEEGDLSGNTVVEVPFLDGEVSNGINQAKSLVDEQASDLQMIMNSIDDILPLHMFDLKL